jgi:hypothetical protein
MTYPRDEESATWQQARAGSALLTGLTRAAMEAAKLKLMHT